MEIIFNRQNGIIAMLFLTVFTLSISAQAPSCKSSLSPICMLHTGTYNKHSKTTNTEIQIGQGTIFSWNTTNDVYIPTNRPGWAIGLAVAHTMFTNLMGFECMSINEYMATAMQETNCGCDGSITKPAWAKAYPVNPAVYCSDYTHGVAVGFFQEEYGTGWAELKKDYPCFIPKVNFDTFVTGKNFETQALAKVYHDYNNIYFLQQSRCFNPIDFIKQCKDPYAAEKIIAEAYNEGMWGQNLQNLLKTNRAAALNATDILPYFFTPVVDPLTKTKLNGSPQVQYSERISRVTAVLDNNLSDVSASSAAANGVTWVGVHKWRDFYDAQITWTDIQSYINNISRMYAGVGVTAAAVIAKVQPVFNSINGGNAVSFRYQLAPVIDAIVAELPVFNPTGLASYGNCGAFPTATMEKSDTVCVGQPLKLTVKFTGKAPWTFTYGDTKGNQWTKSGITANPYNFAPSDTGTYYLISLFDASGNTGKVVCMPIVKAYSNNGAKGDLMMYGGSACSGKGLQIKFTGKGPYDIEYSKDGVAQTPVNNISTNPYTLITAPAPLGRYVLTKVSASGCVNTAKDTVDIANGTVPTAIISGGANICNGDSTQLSVALTGIAPFKIKLSDGTIKWYKSGITPAPTTYKFWTKTAGTYTVDSVYDAACGDKGTGTSVVNINPLTSISISGDTSICKGDTAKLTAILTGKTPFNILVSNGAITIPITTSLNTYIFPLSAAGTYTINVTDANGCKASKKVTIVQGSIPKVDLGNDLTICKGNSKTLDAGLGMKTHTWKGAKTGNTQIMIADVSGKYIVTVTNNEGCFASDSVNLNFQNSLSTKFAQDTISICSGTNTTLQLQSISGGTTPYTYVWSGDANGTNSTYVANTKGTFIITVTEAGGCSISDTVIIIEKAKLAINLLDKIICSGDSAILSTTYNGADYNFSWNTGENTPSIVVKSAGIYGVTVSSGTCSGSDSMNLSLYNSQIVNLGADQNICEKTKANIVAGSAFASYQWSTNDNTPFIQKGAGKYWVQVIDNNGCKSSDTVIITEILNPKPNQIRDTSVCKNATLILDESTFNNNNSPFTYLWDDNSTNASLTLNNLSSNSVHWVEVTDKYGCKGKDTSIITIKANLSVLITGSTDTNLCAGETTVLSSQISGANYQYSWNTGETTASITVNKAGNYTLNIDDGNGCKGSDAIKVNVFPLPDMTKVTSNPAICSGEAATIGFDFGSGYTYNWKSGNVKTATIKAVDAGNYIFEVTNDKGCVNDTTIIVSVHQKPLVDVGNNIDTCEGINLELSELLNTPGVSYSWTKKSLGTSIISNSKKLQINSSDTYKLLVEDAIGCWNADSLEAIFKPIPKVHLLDGKDSAVICNDETITLNAHHSGKNISYLWQPNKENGNSILVNKTSTYSVIVSDGNCTAGDTVYIKSIVLPQNVLSDSLLEIQPHYCFAEETNGVEISALGIDRLNYNYLWNTNETTQNIIVKKKGKYTVEITKDVCKTTSEVSILDYCTTTFFVPEAFSPNGDGKNDVFKIYGTYIPNFEILIFNRWGEQIYQSIDYTQSWDGTYMGNKVQEDVYVIKILYGVNQENGTVKRKERVSKLVVLY